MDKGGLRDDFATGVKRVSVSRISVPKRKGGISPDELLTAHVAGDARPDDLRCDEYSYAFTYGAYLTDRSRAITLAAIAAVAAKSLNDESLLIGARALAEDLRRLPQGVIEAFDANTRLDLEKRTGIVLPEK